MATDNQINSSSAQKKDMPMDEDAEAEEANNKQKQEFYKKVDQEEFF